MRDITSQLDFSIINNETVKKRKHKMANLRQKSCPIFPVISVNDTHLSNLQTWVRLLPQALHLQCHSITVTATKQVPVATLVWVTPETVDVDT